MCPVGVSGLVEAVLVAFSGA